MTDTPRHTIQDVRTYVSTPEKPVTLQELKELTPADRLDLRKMLDDVSE